VGGPAPFLVLALLLGTGPAAREPPAEAARGRAYADAELQTQLPQADADSAPQLATVDLSFLDRFMRWLRKGGIFPMLLRLSAVTGALFAVLLGAVWLARRVAERREVLAEVAAPKTALLDATPLLEAESLAEQARFGEAIHLLLLRTFEMLARRVGSRLAPGMTAREVLVRLGLPEAARPALAELVDSVEANAYAGRPASLDDYERCADRFSVLQRMLGGARA
jgi:hypothetical protein